MKRKLSFFFIFIMIFAGSASAYKSLLTLENDKIYTIIHAGGSGSYLGKRSDAAMNTEIQTPTGDASQQFKCIVNADNTYSLQLISTGEYMGRSNVANNTYRGTFYTSISSDGATRFLVEKAASWSSNAKIKNVKSGAYLGTDANVEGSAVFFDKGGNDGKHYFCIIETTTKQSLKSLIEKAVIYESYPARMSASVSFYDEAKQLEMIALKEAAQAVYDNASAAIAEMNTAYMQLSDAMDTFSTSMVLVNMTETAEKTVRIHSNVNPNLCLIKAYKGTSTNDGGDKITIADITAAGNALPENYDLWNIINVAPGQYIIQNKGTGQFLKIWAENDVYTAANPSDDDGVIKKGLFDIYIIEEGKFAIKGPSDIFLKNETNTDIKMTATATFGATAVFTFEEIKRDDVSLDNPEFNAIRIYPSNGTLYVVGVENANIRIFNMSGGLVAAESAVSGTAQFQLYKGVYVVQVEVGGEQKTSLVVVK